MKEQWSPLSLPRKKWSPHKQTPPFLIKMIAPLERNINEEFRPCILLEYFAELLIVFLNKMVIEFIDHQLIFCKI